MKHDWLQTLTRGKDLHANLPVPIHYEEVSPARGAGVAAVLWRSQSAARFSLSIHIADAFRRTAARVASEIVDLWI